MKLSAIIKRSLKQAFRPGKAWKAYQLQKNKKVGARVRNDAQLKLYADILRSDFLHYGYFKDVNQAPEDVSINDIEQAQLDYAMLFIDQCGDTKAPVLDIGCGIGGLSALLAQKGYQPTALTPDSNQIAYIGQKYPNIPVIQGKFEELEANKYTDHFGIVINSESLQYLNLDVSLPMIDQILAPGGKWLICDYFKIGEAFEHSGHSWDAFCKKLDEHGWKITLEQDITANVAVMLRYLHLLGTRIGIPLANFIFEKFRVKQPGFYYLAEEVVAGIDKGIKDGIEVVNPERFAKEKKYVFMVVERK